MSLHASWGCASTVPATALQVVAPVASARELCMLSAAMRDVCTKLLCRLFLTWMGSRGRLSCSKLCAFDLLG